MRQKSHAKTLDLAKLILRKKRLLHHNYVQNVKQNDEQEQFATFEQGLESKL